MTRYRQWDGPLDLAQIKRWQTWFDSIGVDARDVAVRGWVLVDDDDRTVTFLGIARDDRGIVMVENQDVVNRPMRVTPVAPVPPFPDPWPDYNPDDVVPYERRLGGEA